MIIPFFYIDMAVHQWYLYAKSESPGLEHRASALLLGARYSVLPLFLPFARPFHMPSDVLAKEVKHIERGAHYHELLMVLVGRFDVCQPDYQKVTYQVYRVLYGVSQHPSRRDALRL